MGLTKNGRQIFGSSFYNGSTNIYFSNLNIVNNVGEKSTGILSNNSSSMSPRSKVGNTFTVNCDINVLSTSTYTSQAEVNFRLGICLGTSNASETPDDYTMISTGLTGKSIAFTKASESTMIQGTVTAYNATDEDITVREIGMFLTGDAYSTTYTAENCLLYRKVLPSPVVVKPDETYTFTIILK